MLKGFSRWILIGLLVVILTAVTSFFWGRSAASRKAGTEPTPTPVAMTATNVEDCPRVFPPEKAESVTPPKAEPVPEPVKIPEIDPLKSDPTPQPVPVADPPKAEAKDPATAMPGDIVGTVNPDIKDWPTSQVPKADDPVLLFPAQIWEGARRLLTPDGNPSLGVLFLVDPGTQIVLPFDVQIEKVGGTDATIFAVGPGGERKKILPGLVILTVVPRPEKTDPRRTGAILLYFPSQVSVESRIVRAGQPIVTVPDSEWVFLDAVFDGGAVRLKRFNVAVTAGVSHLSLLKEAETVPGTVDFFRWYTSWLTGAK